MRSTVSASFALLIGFIFGAHLLSTNLLKVDKNDLRSLVAAKQGITPPGPVDALLIGGSGVHYGVNARILTDNTPYRFLNLGIYVEGNSWANYLGFLKSLDMIDHDTIRLVIYSSGDVFSYADSDEFTLTGAQAGVLLFDREAWIKKVTRSKTPAYGPRNVDRTQIDPETGDMVFVDGVCDPYWPAQQMPMPSENIAFIAARAQDLSKLFPNAKVMIRPRPLSEQKGPALPLIYDALEQGLADHNVRLLRPPKPFYDPRWACDAPFHPTAEGRDFLTQLEAVTIVEAMQTEP